eukprot:scaffold28364_cov129-Isochrysis_galbana.AAC.2
MAITVLWICSGLVLDAPRALAAVRSSTPSMQILISGKPEPPKKPSGLIITGPASSVSGSRSGGAGGLLGVGSSTGGSGLLSSSSGSLARADGSEQPMMDPLAKPRPRYDLAPSSGRPDELVFGAASCAAPGLMGEWGAHLRDQGISRVLALCNAAEAEASQAALCTEAGFAASAVTVVDIRAGGAKAATIEAARAAVAARERIAVVDTVGGAHTALVLAQYLHDDYVGGDGGTHSCLEVCELLTARKRHSGVAWVARPEDLQRFLAEGTL